MSPETTGHAVGIVYVRAGERPTVESEVDLTDDHTRGRRFGEWEYVTELESIRSVIETYEGRANRALNARERLRAVLHHARTDGFGAPLQEILDPPLRVLR